MVSLQIGNFVPPMVGTKFSSPKVFGESVKLVFCLNINTSKFMLKAPQLTFILSVIRQYF